MPTRNDATQRLAPCFCLCSACAWPRVFQQRCSGGRLSLGGADPPLGLLSRSGEKLLKSLLLRTAEWGSPEARLALAERCQGGYPGLARVLRREATSAQLRKGDYLEACRAWGYRSSLWQLKPCLDVPGAEVGTWERAVRRRKT